MSARGSAVEQRIEAVTLRERRELRRLLAAIESRRRRSRPVSVLSERLESRLLDAEHLLARRRAWQPRLRYPPQLPITDHRELIIETLRSHPVVVVCGDTGSGKTTQLPKLCLQAGQGIRGVIGITQPRRIAARAVAARLAEELNLPFGEAVGLQVRFDERADPSALVKVMTDGILLNEIRADPLLEAYDTLIIDEAHERSLNIDFVLGYLKRLRRRRPDLKIVITSATIEPERFARHFEGAPIVRVEGRSFPIELRYRGPESGEDLADTVASAVRELSGIDLDTVGGGSDRDILVFLPGERWIRDAERVLRKSRLASFEILPLYARLTATDQGRIFHPGPAPRVVLATNIAETSLTVPRVRFVVDSGLARVSRYSPRHRLQGLGVERIAKANAVQRAGRCGRLAPGVCVRLYSEDEFGRRPPFADPEILRTNLAEVILRLTALELGSVDDFPFLDAPPTSTVKDAYRLLQTLGAVDAEHRLTPAGDLMAKLPVDPRIARLLVSAEAGGALREGLIIASALSVADPRERPADRLAEVREQHAQFEDPRSDFLAYLRLWEAYRQRRRGGRSLERWCRTHFVSVSKLREWEEVHAQLARIADGLGWRAGPARAGYKAIHQAVLAAFVDLVGRHLEGTSYRGIQETRSALVPGSALARRRPRWVVGAERVATEKVYLRTAAQINPRWIVAAAPHLMRREHCEPAWDARRGRVMAREVVKFHGLKIADRKRVDYGRVDPRAAREIFIGEALAGDDLGADPAFLRHNREMRRQVLSWESRLRTRDLWLGEKALRGFYDRALPREVRDRAGLMEWCRDRACAERLRLHPSDVSSRVPEEAELQSCPLELTLAGHRLPLVYRFVPGSDEDGISVNVPRPLLGALRPEQLDWLVPGWLSDKVTALLRTLPKELRRRLVPLPDTAGELLAGLEQRAYRQDLAAALCEVLAERGRVSVAPSAFRRAALPGHLSMRIEVSDASGLVIASGRDLSEVQRRLGTRADSLSRPPAQSAWARRGLRGWDVPDLPSDVAVRHGAGSVNLYPALIDNRGNVDLTLLPPGPGAELRHREGVRRLLVKTLPQQEAVIRRDTLNDRGLLLSYHGIGSEEDLIEDLIRASADASFALQEPIRSRRDFDACLAAGRAALVPEANRLRASLRDLLRVHRELRGRLSNAAGALPEAAVADMEGQLQTLIRPGFLSDTPSQWRVHLPRYLEAVRLRLDKLGYAAAKDAEHLSRIARARERLERWRETWPEGWPWPESVRRYRWLVEEFRVSLFAQALGTAARVSEKRLESAWNEALAEADLRPAAARCLSTR
jgi:ATP-dependent helicase HrpA